MLVSNQSTILREVSLSGNGLFTGAFTTVTLKPAKENEGIVFCRRDQGFATIPAHFSYVHSTNRSTCLENNGVYVHMVEHLLSAIKGFAIDNLIIELDGKELPCGDGSALCFVDLLQKAGRQKQSACKNIYKIKEPVFWAKDAIQIVALPEQHLQITYLLHYPGSKLMESQYATFSCATDSYCQNIAPARTFALHTEIEELQKKGLLQQANLDNGLVIKNDQVLNPGGVRFSNEMARHKVLDLLGDLALLGTDLQAHVIAIRSGHTAHVSFCRALQESMETFSCTK